MSHTWSIDDTTFISNSDLSGDIEIARPSFDGDTVDRIKIPGRILAIFMRNRLVDALNDHFDLHSTETAPPFALGPTISSHLMRTLCRIVDEIIGGIDPPPEYRTAMQVDAWTRGALDAQRAIEKALGNAR